MKDLSEKSVPRRKADPTRAPDLRFELNALSKPDPQTRDCLVRSDSELNCIPENSANGTTEGNRRQERQLLTVREVADLLRVPVSWVYGHTRKRSRERIPGYRVGKYWRFSADEVMSWLRQARRQLASDRTT